MRKAVHGNSRGNQMLMCQASNTMLPSHLYKKYDRFFTKSFFEYLKVIRAGISKQDGQNNAENPGCSCNVL